MWHTACITLFMQTNPITPLVSSGNVIKKTGQAGGDSFFGALMDMINPLQHIPVVSTMYREATGDTISGGAEIIGGGLFGGIPGAISSLFNVGVEAATGKDIAGNILDNLPSGTSGTPLYQAMSATSLVADEGQSLVTIAYTGASAPMPEPLFYDVASTVPQLSKFSDPSLGYKDAYKGEQLKAALDKKAADLIS